MVAEFYTFDEGVMREFLGKTLNKTVGTKLKILLFFFHGARPVLSGITSLASSSTWPCR
jgi:hypothetical protein